jgi:hypothetical protein
MPHPRDRTEEADTPPSQEELAAAEQLRRGLEDPEERSEDAELARSMAAAWEPRDLTPEQHRELVRAALGGRRGGVVIRVSFRASALLALAAAVALVLWSDPRGPHGGGAISLPDLAVSRSTQDLFSERFAPTGGESGRIDRIAMARGADLRDNEFARWGVK